MRRPSILPSLIVVLLISVAIAYVFTYKRNIVSTPVHESVLRRILRTGTIHCGYTVGAPLLMKNPNTGALSGLFYDYMQEMGAALSLRIDWAEETNFADFPTALQAGRFDVMCSGVWPSAARSRQIDFSIPIVFHAINAYVRSDDTRFDNNVNVINDPSVTIAVVDGETSGVIAQADFPQAKKDQMPSITSVAQPFLDVTTHKADVSLSDSATAAGYMSGHPSDLKQVPTANPIRLFGDVLAISQGEDALRRVLDTATQELLYKGTIDKLITKYEQYSGTLLRVAKPYEAP